MTMKAFGSIFCLIILLITSCSSNSESDNYTPVTNTPTALPLDIPQIFDDNIIDPVIPLDNPQTVEGVALGKKLFYDPILSANFTQACASCHNPPNAFTDSEQFSTGIDGSLGFRNSMPLFNLAWNYDEQFFWDGRSFSLEHQALVPVTDPTEMANTWQEVVTRLTNGFDG